MVYQLGCFRVIAIVLIIKGAAASTEACAINFRRLYCCIVSISVPGELKIDG